MTDDSKLFKGGRRDAAGPVDGEKVEKAIRPTKDPTERPTVESTGDTKHREERPTTPYRMTGDVPKTVSAGTESGGEPATTVYVKPRNTRSAPPSQMTDDGRRQALKRMMHRSEAKTKPAAESSTTSDGSEATASAIDGERVKGYKSTNTEDDGEETEEEWDKRAGVAEDVPKTDYAYKRMEERDAENKAEQEEQAKADAQAAKDEQGLGGGTNVDEDGAGGDTYEHADDEYEGRAGGDTYEHADDEYDLGLYGGGVVSKKELDKIGGPSPWAKLSSSISSGLNYTESVASFVDMGLKSSRNVLNAMLNPSATGLKEMDATLTGTMRMLDGVSDFITKQTKSFDERSRWEAKDVENRMKTQFTYMVGKIGEGKDLTEFDRNDLNLLFDNMQRVWGRDVENLMKGKSPEVAAAIRKTNEILLKQIGNRARRLKGSALQDRRYVELDKKMLTADADKQKEKMIQDWLDIQNEDTRDVFNILSEQGNLDPYKAAVKIVNHTRDAYREADKILTSRIDRILQADPEDRYMPEDEKKFRDVEDAMNRLSDFFTKTIGKGWTDDDLKNLADTKGGDWKDFCELWMKNAKIYNALEQQKERAENLGTVLTKEDQDRLDRIKASKMKVEQYSQQRNDNIKFMQTMLKLVPGMGDSKFTDYVVNYFKSSPSKINAIDKSIKSGKSEISALLEYLPPIRQRELISLYSADNGRLAKEFMKSREAQPYIQDANWAAANRGVLKNLENEYVRDNKAQGIHSAIGARGLYTENFKKYVESHVQIDPDTGETYYFDGTTRRDYIPRDSVEISGALRGDATPEFFTMIGRAAEQSDNIERDLGSKAMYYCDNQMMINLLNENIALNNLFSKVRRTRGDTTFRVDQDSLNPGSIARWKQYVGGDTSRIGAGKSPSSFGFTQEGMISICVGIEEDIRKRIVEDQRNGVSPLEDKKIDELRKEKEIAVNTLAKACGQKSIYSRNAYIGQDGKLHAESEDKPDMGTILDIMSDLARKGASQPSASIDPTLKSNIIRELNSGVSKKEYFANVASDVKASNNADKMICLMNILGEEFYRNAPKLSPNEISALVNAKSPMAALLKEIEGLKGCLLEPERIKLKTQMDVMIESMRPGLEGTNAGKNYLKKMMKCRDWICGA